MKKLLIVGVTSLVLFAVSGVASWMLQHSKSGHGGEKGHEASSHADASHGKGGHAALKATGSSHNSDHSSERPGELLGKSVSVPHNSGSEEAVKLAKELNIRLDAVRKTEEGLERRKKDLELLQTDLQGERTAMDDLQKQMKKELEALQSTLATIEQRADVLKGDQKKAKDEDEDRKKGQISAEADEVIAMKKIAAWVSGTQPETAAKILREMVDKGNMKMAVMIVSTMQEKQSSKALDQLGDPALAAKLLNEAMKYRRQANPGAIR